MYLECARIFIGGVKLAKIREVFPRARAGVASSGYRIYVGYDNASGVIYKKADALASAAGGWVESEAD